MSRAEWKQVAIVGGGIASLTAGLEILERDPRAEVTLLTADAPKRLGGHLAAWDEHGFPIEHGLHALFGFYDHAVPMLQRLGVLERHFTRSPRHINVFERGRLHRFRPQTWIASYRGFDWQQKTNLLRFVPTLLRLVREALSDGLDALDAYDDWDFREFLRHSGVGESVLDSNFVRSLYDGPFNHPGTMSAACGLEGLYRILSRPWHYYFNGPSSKCIIDPLLDEYLKAGGRIEYETWLRRIVPSDDGRRVRTLIVERNGKTSRIRPDHVVLAVGLDAFQALDWGPLASLSYVRRVDELRSVSSLSLQMWFREDPTPRAADALMVGLPEPLSICCPLSRVRRGGDPHPRHPFELIATGAEEGFENTPDREIIESFWCVLRTMGFDLPASWTSDPERGGRDLAYAVLRRNDAPAQRYMAPRPGQLASRPDPISPIENLVVAGAWTKTDLVLPCVDTAVASAQIAAAEVVRRMRVSGVPAFVGMPRSAPLVLPPPYEFRDVVGRFCAVRAEPDAVASALPEALVPVRAARSMLLVVALDHREILGHRDPTRSLYRYREVVLAAFVRPRDGSGPTGLYPLSVYVDDDVALAAGREVYGFPKKLAEISWTSDGCEVVRLGRPASFDASVEAFVEPLPILRLRWAEPRHSPMLSSIVSRMLPSPMVFYVERSFADPAHRDGVLAQSIVALPLTEVRIEATAPTEMSVEVLGSAQDPLQRFVGTRPRVWGAVQLHFAFTMDAALPRQAVAPAWQPSLDSTAELIVEPAARESSKPTVAVNS